jgi:hypothetical protein
MRILNDRTLAQLQTSLFISVIYSTRGVAKDCVLAPALISSSNPEELQAAARYQIDAAVRPTVSKKTRSPQRKK